MGDVAKNTFDAGQFLSTAAKNAGELAAQNAATGGEAIVGVKIVKGTLTGKALVFGVIADMTLGGESFPQAVISQTTAAAAAGAIIAAFAVTASGGTIILVAGGAALVAWGVDKAIDALYQWCSKHTLLDALEQLFSTATTTRSPIILDLDGDGIKTLGTGMQAFTLTTTETDSKNSAVGLRRVTACSCLIGMQTLFLTTAANYSETSRHYPMECLQ